jgi:predicted O-methyltransferase YrrM
MNAIQKTPYPIIGKLWREVSRPVRRLASRPNGLQSFNPCDCSVEPEGLNLLRELVRESSRYDGPIIEIGTLLGVTTTELALTKAPHQQIRTVDSYCWNPWGLTPDSHAALASQTLYYLIEKGEVEVIRADKNEYYRAYNGADPAMVFLDAMHDYEETRKDIEWAKQVGAKIISGHDYSIEFPGVIQAVDEFGGPKRLGGTVWAL